MGLSSYRPVRIGAWIALGLVILVCLMFAPLIAMRLAVSMADWVGLI